MKTRAIIEFKDTYASMECHNLGYHITYWTYSIKYTAFQKGLWFKNDSHRPATFPYR